VLFRKKKKFAGLIGSKKKKLPFEILAPRKKFL
jgi:hypothetical protein